MFKGSIELVTAERISGWIWCEITSLRDCTVLAFLNGRCIGSGTVDAFRSDLYEAGLGDGHCGFSFPISPPTGNNISNVYVRMENSDFSLFQTSSDPTAIPATEETHWRESSIEWMVRRGWLSPEDSAFLGAMQEVGAAVVTLPATPPGKTLKGWAADRLSLLLQKDVAVQQARVSRTQVDEMLSARRSGVVCLLPQSTYKRKVLEGSHLVFRNFHGESAVVYRIEPHQALFIHGRCASEPVSDRARCDIDVFEIASPSGTSDRQASGRDAPNRLT